MGSAPSTCPGAAHRQGAEAPGGAGGPPSAAWPASSGRHSPSGPGAAAVVGAQGPRRWVRRAATGERAGGGPRAARLRTAAPRTRPALRRHVPARGRAPRGRLGRADRSGVRSGACPGGGAARTDSQERRGCLLGWPGAYLLGRGC